MWMTPVAYDSSAASDLIIGSGVRSTPECGAELLIMITDLELLINAYCAYVINRLIRHVCFHKQSLKGNCRFCYLNSGRGKTTN